MSQELKDRTAAWAIDTGRLVSPLFRSRETAHRAGQIKDAADSMASNYRAACMGRSHKEFLAKLSIALEECDEAVGFLEMSHREGLIRGSEAMRVLDEGRQLTRSWRSLVKPRRTMRGNHERAKGALSESH